MSECVVGGTVITSSSAPSGLRTGGLVTVVALNSSTWTALPATPLSGRNAVAVQNYSGIEIKINYDTGVAGYVGMTVIDKSERQYDITDAIILYAKSASGTPSVNVEEIA